MISYISVALSVINVIVFVLLDIILYRHHAAREKERLALYNLASLEMLNLKILWLKALENKLEKEEIALLLSKLNNTPKQDSTN